jgi:excisionase family DNA binding protein
MEKQKLCITVDEMSKQLGIGLTNAYKLAQDKTFYPAKRIGTRILIDQEALRIWLKERGK